MWVLITINFVESCKYNNIVLCYNVQLITAVVIYFHDCFYKNIREII